MLFSAACAEHIVRVIQKVLPVECEERTLTKLNIHACNIHKDTTRGKKLNGEDSSKTVENGERGEKKAVNKGGQGRMDS